ncbi:glycosyltransferase, partial [Candidatus Omnitrophota bacterium]
VSFYWRYEKFMRSAESRLHSMLGATGAIYAIRRELFHPIPNDVILDDMYVPLKIVEDGYRAIFDGAAKAYDEVAKSPVEEHRRKTRTLFGNYQIFGLFAPLFNPIKSPIAIQLFSHKLLRVIVPFFLILLFILNCSLLGQNLYQIILLLQVTFYVMALVGGLARNKKCGMLMPLLKVCYVFYVFCLLNFSALSGFIRFLLGSQRVTWNKARGVD